MSELPPLAEESRCLFEVSCYYAESILMVLCLSDVGASRIG